MPWSQSEAQLGVFQRIKGIYKLKTTGSFFCHQYWSKLFNKKGWAVTEAQSDSYITLLFLQNTFADYMSQVKLFKSMPTIDWGLSSSTRQKRKLVFISIIKLLFCITVTTMREIYQMVNMDMCDYKKIYRSEV